MRSRSGSGCIEATKNFFLAGPLSLVLLMSLFVLGVSNAGAVCPNEALRTGASKNLPDCRAYEQATPVDKGGANPRGNRNLVQAASGEGGSTGITFYATGGIPGGEGSQEFPQYLSRRAPDGSGWSTQGLLPPASNGSRAFVRGYSEDLSQTYALQGNPGVPGATFYQLDSATHALRQIANGLEARKILNRYAGASADGLKVLMEFFGIQLPPGAEPGTQNTYVWDKPSSTLTPAGLLNPTGAPPVPPEAPPSGTSAGSYQDQFEFTPENYTSYENAISANGSRVFFTSVGTRQIYLRRNPTQPQSPMAGNQCTVPADACTVEVSAPEVGVIDPNGEQPATLWFATPDGSKAFFTSPGKLTTDANTGPADEGNDLYRYDADAGTGELIDLTPDAIDPNGADVQGVLGASEDGSYVYFVANGVLAPGAVLGDCQAAGEVLESTDGNCNLYLWHEGDIAFIAPQHAEANDFLSDAFNWIRKPATNNDDGGEKTARVTPDGLTLLFRSQEQLTSYDNKGLGELYRYSAGDDNLICISCNNPSGVAPVGSAGLQDIRVLPLNEPPPAPVQTRNLSADGNRIFFESPDKLVASDTNGDAGCSPAGTGGSMTCQDVYEWEAMGTGSCESKAENGGCLHLLSTGTSPEPSFFGDASLSGDDAFIFTAQSLVAQDKDELVDVYDARVGGGIESQNTQPEPPCESNESCKPPPPPPPVTQSSPDFQGPGNPLHCKKGMVKKHGKCVKKKHSRKKKHHKKHHTTRKHG